jgi:hypothetical protein
MMKLDDGFFYVGSMFRFLVLVVVMRRDGRTRSL